MNIYWVCVLCQILLRFIQDCEKSIIILFFTDEETEYHKKESHFPNVTG